MNAQALESEFGPIFVGMIIEQDGLRAQVVAVNSVFVDQYSQEKCYDFDFVLL